MSSVKLFLVVVLFTFLKLSKSQRRIKDGKDVTDEKKYVVYLTRATMALQEYDFWLCGGAIVSEWYIITSAACVEDVRHLYAVAGYKKYVPFSQIHKDVCTQQTKKRIIFTCVPKLHEFEYNRVEKWSQVDIAVVKVESPYDFRDVSIYISLCDYAPERIEVNYDPKVQEPGRDALVFGWGHKDKWRKPEDTKDYNQEKLQFASTYIHDKEDCKQYFSGYPALGDVIDKYMICTLEAGNINEAGRLLMKAKPKVDGCLPVPHHLKTDELMCEEDETISVDDYRKNMLSRMLERQQNHTRKQGICQNDHGGPLVAWSGTHEVLIGVASVFRVTAESTCTGPYLFTSTQCNGAFLDCILQTEFNKTTRRNEICDRPPREKGFDTLETHISWMDHPDGPAHNELQMPSSHSKKPSSTQSEYAPMKYHPPNVPNYRDYSYEWE